MTRFSITLFLATLSVGPSAGFSGIHAPISSSSSSALRMVNNNVVLRPSSEDPEAFDSLKVGNARVHRYSRDDVGGTAALVADDAETEYVMWYHGRSQAQDQPQVVDQKSGKTATLPPLSTGRIGRATSRNGLSWKKDATGSLSEDLKGSSLGLNQESWWGFDTAHVGLGNVLLPMSTPAVMTEGGVYLMYYMGGNFEEKPIAEFLDDPSKVPADAQIAGMNMKIGVCVSQDGITWGRVEGDDPSGACVIPFVKDDPNCIVADGVVIPEELYCAWPDVVVNFAAADGKEKEESSFFMYYSTMTKDDKQKKIAYAVSSDGFRWIKRGLCLSPDVGDDSLDAAGCARCHVTRNAIYDESTSTWNDANGYTMWYEGVSAKDNKHRILAADSPDGRTWFKRSGVALDVGSDDDAWDCEGVGAPHVLRMDDGSQRMYYTGQGKGGSTAIGVAKLEKTSDDTWVREQATITFA